MILVYLRDLRLYYHKSWGDGDYLNWGDMKFWDSYLRIDTGGWESPQGTHSYPHPKCPLEFNQSLHTQRQCIRRVCTLLLLDLTQIPSLVRCWGFSSDLPHLILNSETTHSLFPILGNPSFIAHAVFTCSMHAPHMCTLIHSHIWEFSYSFKPFLYTITFNSELSILLLTVTLFSLAHEMKPCTIIGWILFCVLHWLPINQYKSPSSSHDHTLANTLYLMLLTIALL